MALRMEPNQRQFLSETLWDVWHIRVTEAQMLTCPVAPRFLKATSIPVSVGQVRGVGTQLPDGKRPHFGTFGIDVEALDVAG
jgi:hypothetical protein